MSAIVRIPAPLAACTNGRRDVRVSAATVDGALSQAVERHPALRRHLYGEDGRLRAYVNVFLNEEDVRVLEGGGTPVSEGDTVLILPSIAGG